MCLGDPQSCVTTAIARGGARPAPLIDKMGKLPSKQREEMAMFKNALMIGSLTSMVFLVTLWGSSPAFAQAEFKKPAPSDTKVIISTDVKVAAKDNSVTGGVGAKGNAKITVTPGQRLIITVDPKETWSANPNADRTSNANGLGNPLGSAKYGLYQKNCQKLPYGALVGSLDGGNTFFAVGTYLEMTILVPGELTLHYWDENNFDNGGSIRASVKSYAVK
jgi:hypothetical protein